MLGVLSLLPDLERYYKSSVPDSIAAAIWFTGTTKKSHAYVTLTDGLIILDHEDPSRASGFHSPLPLTIDRVPPLTIDRVAKAPKGPTSRGAKALSV